MRRSRRVLLEIFAPPALGALVMTGIAFAGVFAGEKSQPTDFIFREYVQFITIAGYTIGGIPALIYTGIMEIGFASGLKPGGRPAIALSSSLGAIAGFAVAWMLRDGRMSPVSVPVALSCDGLFVGLMIGLMIRRGSRPMAPT